MVKTGKDEQGTWQTCRPVLHFCRQLIVTVSSHPCLPSEGRPNQRDREIGVWPHQTVRVRDVT